MRLRYHFEFIQAIRDFFNKEGFLDVITPPAVQNPGMEVHIHPYSLYSEYKKEKTPLFLHTSPEFAMKKLMSLKSEGFEDIYQISYCFRDEPKSEIHRPQFLMLEWYRKEYGYAKIMKDCKDLIEYLESNPMNLPMKSKLPAAVSMTIEEVFMEYCGFNIHDFTVAKELKEKIRKDFPDVPVPDSELSWDDYYFLLFLNKIEPHLKKHPFLFLYEYPAKLAALSVIKENKPKVCERFELYLRGVEIGNAFRELTDFNQQKKRFDKQMQEKIELYDYKLNTPTEFYETLQRGLPESSGIAVGVERLFASLVKTENPFFH
jgi:lysyl-tRNA synthetase class 2